MRFESKIDWWIPTLLFGGLSLGTLEWVMGTENTWYDGLGLCFGWCLSVWIVLQTYYEFRGNYLTIRCGPFSRKLYIDDIEGAAPTRNPLASMALSLDRLAIKTRGGRGVLISPRDKEQFLKHLGKKKGPEGPKLP
jgi:hypothetical protein